MIGVKNRRRRNKAGSTGFFFSKAGGRGKILKKSFFPLDFLKKDGIIKRDNTMTKTASCITRMHREDRIAASDLFRGRRRFPSEWTKRTADTTSAQ